MSDTDQRRDRNQLIIEEFRANEGRVGGPFTDVPLLLLHNRGAKTGAVRINPVAYLEEGGRLYVFASNGGREPNPGWFYNVSANPDVTVEVGTRTFDARAVVLEGSERDRVFAAMVARQPGFGDYQSKLSRTIPVVALDEAA